MSICSAVRLQGGLALSAAVRNGSSKPLSRIDVIASFYQSFRYRSVAATAFLQPELDPGRSRRVLFTVLHPDAGVRGQAIRCYATHLGYLDGTSDDAPPVH